jgi:hypothetical protein
MAGRFPDAVGVRSQPFVFSFAEDEPVDRRILGPPDEVFGDAVALVGPELFVRVDAHGAGGNFGDQFGRAGHVSVHEGRPTAEFGVDDQGHVRLGFILKIQSNGRIVTRSHSRRRSLIDDQPTDEVGVLFAVDFEANGRRHVDDPLDELRFLDVGHGVITPFELGPGEVVPGFEGWDFGSQNGSDAHSKPPLRPSYRTVKFTASQSGTPFALIEFIGFTPPVRRAGGLMVRRSFTV